MHFNIPFHAQVLQKRELKIQIRRLSRGRKHGARSDDPGKNQVVNVQGSQDQLEVRPSEGGHAFLGDEYILLGNGHPRVQFSTGIILDVVAVYSGGHFVTRVQVWVAPTEGCGHEDDSSAMAASGSVDGEIQLLKVVDGTSNPLNDVGLDVEDEESRSGD